MVGVESTVVKIEDGVCTILRPGGVTFEQISEVIPVKKIENSGLRTESPGQLESHYAPWTPFYLLPKLWDECSETTTRVAPTRAGLLSFQGVKDGSFFESIQILSRKGDLNEAAAKLFQQMRKLDKMHLDILLAEPVPEKGIGIAIMDRLRKASGGKTITSF